MGSGDNIPARRSSGKARRAGPLALLVCGLLMAGCSSVRQMQESYEAGDASQFERIAKIAARPDYPYATRRAAAKALGEIGEQRGVPILVHILGEFDQRTTLKQEALIALGKIGDPAAVTAIGRLLDRSLGDSSDELRMAALPILGELGGGEAATILVNALAYYDLVVLRKEGRVPRGVFTGDEGSMRDLQDSLLAASRRSGEAGGLGGGLTGNFGSGGMFGPELSVNREPMVDTTEDERRLAHLSLVAVGEAAVPVITEHLSTQRTTPTLRNQLRDILAQIAGAEVPGEVPGASPGEAPGEADETG